MNQVILDTDDENVKMIIRTAGIAGVQFVKQVTETGPEEATGEGETQQHITITRTLLTTLT